MTQTKSTSMLPSCRYGLSRTNCNENTMVKIIIYGRLDGLNKYVNDNRNNRYKGSKNKRDNEKVVFKAIQALKDVEACVYPISIRTTWYEPDKRRDGDNIVFAKKYILDTLVKRGIIIIIAIKLMVFFMGFRF